MSALAAAAVAFALPVVAATPATAMEIKKDDSCVSYDSPSFEYNNGDPQVGTGDIAVHNCVTVTP